MTVEKALQRFMECQEETMKALEELKNTVKSEGSKIIQDHVMKEDFESVTHVVGELNSFTKLQYNSNVEEVVEFVRTVFGEMTVHRQSITTSTEIEEPPASIFQPKKELSDELEEVIKTIGYSGISRVKDAKRKINEETIYELEAAGFLMTQEMKWGEKRVLTFELNSKGRKRFEEMFDIEPNESFIRELMKKYPTIETGYFLYDVENGFSTRDYIIHELTEDRVEISKDNYHYYLTPDTGNFEEEDYIRILDEQNNLKSIGFICVDEQTLQKKTRKAVEKWVATNKAKCKFLSIHLTTVENIESSQKIFDTMSF